MKSIIFFTSIVFLFFMTSCSKIEKIENEINVIQVASLKGKIFPTDKNGLKIGGLSLISQKIKDIKKESNISDLVLIGNSNFIHGTPDAYFTEGKAVIELMNLLKFNLMIIGHRELYFGKNVLINLSKTANFPFVSANIVETDGSVPDFIKPYVIFPKMNLAVIGITTHMFTETNITEDLQGLRLLPIDAALKRYVKELKNKNIKNIALAGDLLFGGSTEIERNKQLFQALNVEGIDLYFVRSREVKGNVGIITYKAQSGSKKILICEGVGKTIGYYSSKKEKDSYKIHEISSKTSKPDLTLTDYFVDLKKTINSIAGGIIGNSAVQIEHSFKKETALGNLITDVCREYINSEIFMFNNGSVRVGFDKGKISRLKMYNILPWGGTLIETEVTGSQLLKLLEASCSLRLEKSFLSVSGVVFKFDSSKEKGSRVIKNSVKIGGEGIDLKRKYSLGTGRYIYDGGDKYTEFKDLNLPLKRIEPKSIREIMVEFILKNKTISSKIDGRILDVNNE